jgi:beta-lactamase regulating signal transducer with metallopeptidase domain
VTASVLVEAGLRGGALIAMTWCAFKALRIRDFSVEKDVWTFVLLAALSMPLLAWGLRSIAPPLDLVRSSGQFSTAPLHVAPSEFMVVRGEQLCLIVYFIGLVVFAARLATGMFLGSRLRRSATRLHCFQAGATDVRVSARLNAPASFASTILLPPGYGSWSPAMLSAVLAHEGAHIRNHDHYRLWLAMAYRTIFWFDPLAHFLYRRLQMLTELTSDEAAVAAIGDKTLYADILSRVATTSPWLPTTLAMGSRSTLARRLRTIAAWGRKPIGRLQIAALTAGLVLLVSISAVPVGRAAVLAAQRMASLEFYLVDEGNDAYSAQQTGKLPPGDRLYVGENGRPVLVRHRLAVRVAGVSVASGENGTAVFVKLDKRSAAQMLKTTTGNIGKRLAVVYVKPAAGVSEAASTAGSTETKTVISDAVIRGAFSSQFQITGLTDDDAKTLASQVDQSLAR